jgi:Probable sensor domain DACNG/Probable sensor domain DACNH
MNVIDLFMWGYQQHFQISAESAAKEIFSKLDKDLSPRVFLVGILFQQRHDSHPVCLQPEECGFEPTMFLDVTKRALVLVNENEQDLHYTDAASQDRYERTKKLRAIKDAIHEIISTEDERHGVVSFVSWPVAVEGYNVVIVLQLVRQVFNKFYRLTKRLRDDMSFDTSLLDATINEYFRHCVEALSKPNPGADLRIIDRDYDELIRSAGKALMYSAAYPAGEIDGVHGLFDACNTISSLPYEGAESTGGRFVGRKDHPNIEISVALSNPVGMRDHRAVRKLLQMASAEIFLLSDSAHVYGLGKACGMYDEEQEDLFSTRFIGHHNWDLFHASHLMMRVTYGQPSFPKRKIDPEKFKSDFNRIFGVSTTERIADIWQLILEAAQQKHGTMVVVSEGAAEECRRLHSV